MSAKLISFFNKYNNLDILLLTLTLLMPFALILSIFIADLIASLIGLIFLFILFKSDNKFKLIQEIKKPLALIVLFYLIILVSLIDTASLKQSFLPSFFYFRYILFSLGVFYLIKNQEYFIKLILYSLIALILMVTIDVIFEYFKNNSFFGFEIETFKIKNSRGFYITSFFDEEKKLGSFLIRLLPFLLSLMIYLNISTFNKFKIDILLFLLFGCLIFLTSERTAFFLYFIFSIFYFRVIKNKLIVFLSMILLMIFLIATQYQLIHKYIIATLFQLNVIESPGAKFHQLPQLINFSDLKFYSTEHEELIKTGIIHFKKEPFTGSGVKTFFSSCREHNLLRNEWIDSLSLYYFKFTNGIIYGKQNGLWPHLICSTHPHSTYIQLLSDIGIFGFLIIAFFFIYIVSKNVKIFFRKTENKIIQSYYVLNLGLILNLLPFAPSGSFFNNWINLMIYFPLGFWFYLHMKYKNENY